MATERPTHHSCVHKEELEDIPFIIPKDKIVFALDMGATLIKFVRAYPSKDPTKCTLLMMTFVQKEMDSILEFIRDEFLLCDGGKVEDYLGATSGVTFRNNKKRFTEILGGPELPELSEFDVPVRGLIFCMDNMAEGQYLHPYHDFPVQDDRTKSYMYNPEKEELMFKHWDEYTDKNDKRFPLIIGNLGSAFAMTLVRRDGTYNTIGGSGMSGLFMYSMAKLLTGCKSYDEFLELARKGNSGNLSLNLRDMLGGSDYCGFDMDKAGEGKTPEGMDYLTMLPEVFPFGKVVRQNVLNPSNEDKARALLRTVADNFISEATSVAQNCPGVSNVYFCGSTLNDMIQERLNVLPMVSASSGPAIYPRFIKCSGYLSALGCIATLLKDSEKKQ